MRSDIATASIGPRSAVATGPEEIQGSKWELEADTERFIQAAEVRFENRRTARNYSNFCFRKLYTPMRGQLTMFSYSHLAFLMEEWKIQCIHSPRQQSYPE